MDPPRDGNWTNALRTVGLRGLGHRPCSTGGGRTIACVDGPNHPESLLGDLDPFLTWDDRDAARVGELCNVQQGGQGSTGHAVIRGATPTHAIAA
eukprot:15476035-Alexandrium_andersonii.AAC.2